MPESFNTTPFISSRRAGAAFGPAKYTRRDILKILGLAAGASALPRFARADERLNLSAEDMPPVARPVTAITIGAGRRASRYGAYATRSPGHFRIVGVAEPVPIRNERHARLHGIPEGNRFKTWEDVFTRPKFADAVLITTPDDLHYGPCMAALEAGYDVLLEKPISPSEEECRRILELANRTGRIVGVCHVLRYAPYFARLHELLRAGVAGELVSIQHLEPIGHVHMSHSYVRGNWHNSRETAPIILAKSSHDLDILRWLAGQPCRRIQAFGSLKWFRRENAPGGSTARCTDGCAVEAKCPYSALRIYHRQRSRTHVFDLPDDRTKHADAILAQLRTSNYGRCVYRMDNDQPDHYVANMLFEKDITASFSMQALTSYEGRRTSIMGSHGDVVGDMTKFTLTDFSTGEQEVFSMTTDTHGGGDLRLVANWVQAVARQDPGLLGSSLQASVESHVMAFAAERSRLENSVEDVRM